MDGCGRWMRVVPCRAVGCTIRGCEATDGAQSLPPPAVCRQETEEALEELRQKLRDTKTRMDAEAQGLQGQVCHRHRNTPCGSARASRGKWDNVCPTGWTKGSCQRHAVRGIVCIGQALLLPLLVTCRPSVSTLRLQVSTLQASIVAAREKAKRLKDRTLENEGAFTLSMGSSNAPTSSVTGSSGPGGPVNLKELGDKVGGSLGSCWQGA